MLLNYETVLVGDKCVLVPYRPIHVVKYHAWMQDPALLEATASEPLSLEEEYDMQESWRVDEAKCTFIVLARELLLPEFNETLESLMSKDRLDDFIQNSQHAMVGDVNMFLSELEPDDETDDASPHSNTAKPVDASHSESNKPNGVNAVYRQAELDIMIAEPHVRGQGVGHEAARLMMLYGATNLHLCRIFSKINEDNAASLHLFRAKLGFQQCAYAECFRQVELELRAESSSQLVDLVCTNQSHRHGTTLVLQTLVFPNKCHPRGKENA